jgi:3-isopropylmalate/(R)-2-methylmalate dehydratase small subunit
MQPFTCLSDATAPLLQPNIDTDLIMPMQFLKDLRREGVDRSALFNRRFDKSGAKELGFILIRPPWTAVKFLVTGPN